MFSRQFCNNRRRCRTLRPPGLQNRQVVQILMCTNTLMDIRALRGNNPDIGSTYIAGMTLLSQLSSLQSDRRMTARWCSRSILQH